MKAPFNVTKSTGEPGAFEADKLRRSLLRAGAGADKADAIVAAVVDKLYEGIPTKTIYQIAFKLLKQQSRPEAARYTLKQALLDLGPAGYPFEQFVARLLQADGFSVKTEQIMQGACVKHEVDVLAVNETHVYYCECKFHNRRNLECDVKVPLYIHARYNDLKQGELGKFPFAGKTLEGHIFTNTRFTDDAQRYGQCAGLQLVSWNAPLGNSLSDWANRTRLHPLTCLTTLTRAEKNILLEQKAVLAQDLIENPDLLGLAHIHGKREAFVLEEARRIIG